MTVRELGSRRADLVRRWVEAEVRMRLAERRGSVRVRMREGEAAVQQVMCVPLKHRMRSALLARLMSARYRLELLEVVGPVQRVFVSRCRNYTGRIRRLLLVISKEVEEE